MRWLWYLLSANLAITAITVMQIASTPAFYEKSIPKRLVGIASLGLFGVFIMVVVLAFHDWRKPHDKE